MPTALLGDTVQVGIGSWGTGCFVNMTYISPTAPTRTGLNFMCGQDYVFHCNPRYDEGVTMPVQTHTRSQYPSLKQQLNSLH